jgi:hypothetical protein
VTAVDGGLLCRLDAIWGPTEERENREERERKKGRRKENRKKKNELSIF